MAERRFRSWAWRAAMDSLGHVDLGVDPDAVEAEDALALNLEGAAQAPSGATANCLVVLVESMLRYDDADAVVAVADRSARMVAQIHERAMKRLGNDIRSGSVLVLRGATIVASAAGRCLNVHDDDVVLAVKESKGCKNYVRVSEGLALEADRGADVHVVSRDALCALIGAGGEVRTRLVFVSACHSEPTKLRDQCSPELVRTQVPAVNEKARARAKDPS